MIQRSKGFLSDCVLIRHMKDFSTGASGKPRPFKRELKEFGGGVRDTSNDPRKKDLDENIKASIYHPFFVTSKARLTIGHVTDIHLDTRMDVYGQSEASVIEVKENCPVTAEDGRRKIVNREFHSPIKDRIANFNRIFMDICDRLVQKGANALVITGDLVDYNRGLHAVQTHRTCFTPISETWEALSSGMGNGSYYKDDRNWFLFYQKLLDLYDRHRIPVFTMLGNHDYVNYGMAPWPINGFTWNGVFDQNLTLYESALCFGEGYNGSLSFLFDVIEKTDYVEWYTIFINPFMDYVVDHGDLSLLMVDWGVKSNVATSVFKGSGSLHHARHLFRKKSDYDRADGDGMGGEVTVTNHEPFPVRNYSIYESWIKQTDKVKILFMHATGICPRDNVSIGQINHDLRWTDNEMRYGSFDHRRDEILGDVEKGDLHMIVAGHSHRNVVFAVDRRHEKRARVLGDGETYGILTRPAKNLVMVTSSGGPLPRYLPGGPRICACPEKYGHGWDYETRVFGKNTLYEYTYGDVKQALAPPDENGHRCPRCGMAASDMAAKRPKRHRPGGSLLKFDTPSGKDSGPMVSIESIPSGAKGCHPRRGVLCDEHQVFTQSMKMEHIDCYDDFKYWKDEAPISIISRKPFTFHGDMDFPDRAIYVTFSKGRLGDRYPVAMDRMDGKKGFAGDDAPVDCKRVIRQYIGKEMFEFLLRAAHSDADFAFARYSFNSSFKDTWDREIKMYKEVDTSRPEETVFNPQTEDPYRGLVMFFLRKPDLKKRKRVCGY